MALFLGLDGGLVGLPLGGDLQGLLLAGRDHGLFVFLASLRDLALPAVLGGVAFVGQAPGVSFELGRVRGFEPRQLAVELVLEVLFGLDPLVRQAGGLVPVAFLGFGEAAFEIDAELFQLVASAFLTLGDALLE